MGAVIKHWVLTKLGLPMPEYLDPSDLRRGLSNGYLLAEILRKYNYISDDQLISLGRNFSEKTRLKNMRYVERWMRDSGFEVNFAELLDIVEEKPGAVIKFLYRLYFLLEGSTLRCELDDPKTILQEKHTKKSKRKSKKLNKDKKLVEPDLQIGTKLTKAVQQIKKCMIRQMCAKDDVEPSYEIFQEDQGPRSDTPSRPPPCPFACPCQRPQQQPSVPKPKFKRQNQNCVDTQKYFQKKLSCEKSSHSKAQPVLEPCNCPSPKKQAEIKALKKLMNCQKFPVSNPVTAKGDNAEGTNLYFASKAILQAKENKRKVLKALCTTNIRIERRIICPGSLNEVKLSTILERQKFERLKAKVQAEFNLAKEMETYDEMVQDPEYPKNTLNRPPRGQNQEWTPIQPSFRVMQLKMQKLKCSRKQEAENVADRARLRKALCARMVKEIPCSIYEDLMDTAMKKAMALCGKEAEMADFLIDTHQEKAMFYNHLKYEETSLQRIRCVQDDNLALNRQRECDLQRTVTNTAAKHTQRMTYETLVARQEAEAVKNKKIVQDILSTTVDIVTKICQYRSATGSDPPKGLLQEWKASMFLHDTGSSVMNKDRSGAEVDMLDQLRLDDYLLYQGEWHLPIVLDPGSTNSKPPENEVLKKIVNNLMEILYPMPKAAKTKKEPIQSDGVFALCGVEFVWKQAIVTELLQAALPDHQFEIVDTATTIRDAVLLYAGSLEQPTLSSFLEPLQEFDTAKDDIAVQEQDVGQDITDETQANPGISYPGEDGDGTIVEDVRRASKMEKADNEHLSDHLAKSKKKSMDKKLQKKESSSLKRKSADAGNVKKSKKNGKRATKLSTQIENEIPLIPKTQSKSKTAGIADNKSASGLSNGQEHDGTKERSKRGSVKKDKKKIKGVESNGQQLVLEADLEVPTVSTEESPTAALVAETLLQSQPEPETEAPNPSTVKSMEKGWEEFKNLGKQALDQLLQGKQVDDEITGRILAEKLRHCKPGTVIVILNYPNALCQALNLENSVKDISIDIPLCYHHVDSLIERYRQSWSEEAGDLLNLAMRHAAHVGKNRSEFFKKTDMRKCDSRKKSAAFHSFLDGLLIADVNFNDKLAQILQEKGEYEDEDDGMVQMDSVSVPQTKMKFEPVPDRAEVLLHTAFLHLKRFYLQEQVAVIVPMNSDEDEYYATMAYVVQKTLAKRKQVGSSRQQQDAFEDPIELDRSNHGTPEEEGQLDNNHGLEKKPSSLIAMKDVPDAPSPTISGQIHTVNSDTVGTLGGGKVGKSKKVKPGKVEDAAGGLGTAPKSSGGVATITLDEAEEGTPGGVGLDSAKTQGPRKSIRKKNRLSESSEVHEQSVPTGPGVAHVGSLTEEQSDEHLKEAEEGDHEIEEEAEDEMNVSTSKSDQLAKLQQNQTTHHSKGSRYQAIIAHIPKDALQGLGDFWMNLETTFITVLRGILANIRQHHDMLAQYAADFRDQFRELLERPDDRMALVAEFQVEFNEIIDDVREDVDVKTELHARVDELLERLEAVSEEKYASAKDDIFKTLSDGFLEGETEIMVNFFVSLVRAETDRFCDTIQFINDFYKMSGLGMPDAIPWAELAEVDLLADLSSVKKGPNGSEEKGVEGVGDVTANQKEQIGRAGNTASHTSLPKKLSEKGEGLENETIQAMVVTPPVAIPDLKDEEKLPKKRSKNRRLSNVSGASNIDKNLPVFPNDAAPEVGEKVTPVGLGVEGEEIEKHEEDQAGPPPTIPNPDDDELPMPTSRSVCATASTALSWEFDVFNPDAYYDDEDINIEDSDFYEDELTLDQISFTEEDDVDSWPDAGTLFDASEEEYGTTSGSSVPETRDRHRDLETVLTEGHAEGEEEEGEEQQQNGMEDQDCGDESSGHEGEEHLPVEKEKRPSPSSESSISQPKLSPQGSQSSLPESFFLGDSLCDESPPLSAVSSGASCLNDSKEDLRKRHSEFPEDQPEADTALSSCESISGSGESCESDGEEETEQKNIRASLTPAEKKGNKHEEEEEGHGDSEEEEEITNLIKVAEADTTNTNTNIKGVEGKQRTGSKVTLHPGVKFNQDEDEEDGDISPGEVFIESDGGNDYEDDTVEDFDFLEPHWKFKPKRTFMDMILDSFEEAWSHFDTVVDISKSNVVKVEGFMMESILKGSPERPVTTGSTSEVTTQSVTKTLIKKKGKKMKSKSNTGGALGILPSEPEKSSVIPVLTSSNVPKQQLEGTNSKKHVKGSKRLADWDKCIRAEINRVKYQVAVIQARAVKELKQVKDIIVQIVSDAKVDASNFYIDELQSALMTCEIFRFAIENETGVQAKIAIEKNRFSIEPDKWFKPPSPLPPVPMMPPSSKPEASSPNLSDEEDDDDEEEDPSSQKVEKGSNHSEVQDDNDEEEDKNNEDE